MMRWLRAGGSATRAGHGARLMALIIAIVLLLSASPLLVRLVVWVAGLL